MKNKTFLIALFLFPFVLFSQSDFEKVLKSSEIIVNGLSFIKSSTIKNESKYIEHICVINKRLDKITFKLLGIDVNNIDIHKELVVQRDGKECIFNVPKGIWSFEIILSDNIIYKKGEYKLNDETLITIKEN